MLPSLAEFAYELYGRNYCEKNMNFHDANERFGEGWMNG
jgi:hypothetical protein